MNKQLARVGQRVGVDVSGLSHGGVTFGPAPGSTTVFGTITAIDVPLQRITVRLDVAFGGTNTVTVSPDRIKATEP